MPHIQAVAVTPKISKTSAPHEAPGANGDFAALLAGAPPAMPHETPPIAHEQRQVAQISNDAPPQDAAKLETALAKPDVKPQAKLRDKSSAPPKPQMPRLPQATPLQAKPQQTSITAPQDEEEPARQTSVTPVRAVTPPKSAMPAPKVMTPVTPEESDPDVQAPQAKPAAAPQARPPQSTKLAAETIEKIVTVAKTSVEKLLPEQITDVAPKPTKAVGQDKAPAVVKSDAKPDAPQVAAKAVASVIVLDKTRPVAQTIEAAKPDAPHIAAKAVASVVVLDKAPPHPVAPAIEAAKPDRSQQAAKLDAGVQTAKPDVAPKAVAQMPDTAIETAKPAAAQATVQVEDASRAAPEPVAHNAPAPSSQPAVQSAEPAPPNPASAPSVMAAPAPVQTQTAAAPQIATAAPQPPIQTAPQPVQPNVAALAAAIAAKSGQGAKSFEIRLDPPELGRVEVHLTIAHDGKADATLYADRIETIALLQRDSHNLERALKEAGLDVSNSSLNFSLKGDGRQGDGGGASRAHTRDLPNAVVARSEAVNASLAAQSLAPNSARLDIRV